MRSGEAIRDGQGTTYQIGQTMGRGLWGNSFLIRKDGSESLHVLKIPLGAEDFKTDPAIANQLVVATRECAVEQFRLYEQGGIAYLPRLEGRLVLPDGRTGFILPRLHDSMERRLNEGVPLSALLNILAQILRAVRTLGQNGGYHGNLRGSNIFFNERGELLLTDIATPTLRRAFARLVAIHPHSSNRFPPPELMERPDDGPWSQGVDTYGIAVLMLQGLLSGEPMPPIWREGLTKQTSVHLKHRIIERLKQEDANPRFHQRMADRTVAFLSRALSREMAPCPPYRFNRLDEFQTRLEELIELIHPRIHAMGRVLLERPPTQSFFLTDEPVRFSCTVGVSNGVEGLEEIGVGMAVFDLDRSERLKPKNLSYRIDKHPSGRFRFQFGIDGLGPGRYRTRLAFTIRDTRETPTTNEIDFLIRPAAGWTPPVEAPPPGSLPFPGPDARADARPEPPPEPRPEPPRPDTRPGFARPDLRAEPHSGRPEVDPRDLRAPAPRLASEVRAPEPPRPEPRSAEPPRPEPRPADPLRAEAPEHRPPGLRLEPPRVEPRPEPRADSVRLDLPRVEIPRPEPRLDAPREGSARVEIPRADRAPQDTPREVLPPVLPLPLPRNEPPRAEPGPAEPRFAEPRLAEPRLAEPRLAEPRLAEPRLAEPRLAEPRLADPRLAELSLRLVEPRATGLDDPRPDPRAATGLNLRIMPGAPPAAQVKPLPLDPRIGPSPLQSLFEPPVAAPPPPAGTASVHLPLNRPAPRPAQAPPRMETAPTTLNFLNIPGTGRPADPRDPAPPPPRPPAPPRPPPPTPGSRDPLGEDTPPTGTLSRSWAMGPLPGPTADPAVVEEEDPTTSLTDESVDYTDATVAEEPGLLERIVQTFRTDPVTIVMVLLAVAIVVILIILLLQSSG